MSSIDDRDSAAPRILVLGEALIDIVERDGATRHLGREDLEVGVDDTWTSALTGAAYPAAWTITVPGKDLVIGLVPTVPQQELDTRATTGVVYWEGSQVVTATRGGAPLGGQAYVELTGYAGGE